MNTCDSAPGQAGIIHATDSYSRSCLSEINPRYENLLAAGLSDMELWCNCDD
jgi:hypothetical protein